MPGSDLTAVPSNGHSRLASSEGERQCEDHQLAEAPDPFAVSPERTDINDQVDDIEVDVSM